MVGGGQAQGSGRRKYPAHRPRCPCWGLQRKPGVLKEECVPPGRLQEGLQGGLQSGHCCCMSWDSLSSLSLSLLTRKWGEHTPASRGVGDSGARASGAPLGVGPAGASAWRNGPRACQSKSPLARPRSGSCAHPAFHSKLTVTRPPGSQGALFFLLLCLFLFALSFLQ